MSSVPAFRWSVGVLGTPTRTGKEIQASVATCITTSSRPGVIVEFKLGGDE